MSKFTQLLQQIEEHRDKLLEELAQKKEFPNERLIKFATIYLGFASVELERDEYEKCYESISMVVNLVTSYMINERMLCILCRKHELHDMDRAHGGNVCFYCNLASRVEHKDGSIEHNIEVE